LKARVEVVMTLLLCGVLLAQSPALQNASEKTLDAVYDAREQADNFLSFAWDNELKKAIAGNSKAGDLANKIDDDRKRQHKWEVLAWSLPRSSLQAGESIYLELGSGVVAVSGTVSTAISRGLPPPPSSVEPGEKVIYADTPSTLQLSHKHSPAKPGEIIYTVKAPPEIRSRILMEGLRQDLNGFYAILRFDGRDPESDDFVVAWKGAWFDAQGIYCKYNPGAKFTDLNNEEQTCNSGSPTKR
jgi:hypothetical protein